MSITDGKRKALLAHLFPEGVPTLWCPPLTHYRADGAIDFDRMTRHMSFLSRHVSGFLVPGSTGDGWEMTADEHKRVLQFAISQATTRNTHLIVGVLKTTAAEMRKTIADTLSMLKQSSGKQDVAGALRASHVRGFAVCPPKGSQLSQNVIRDELRTVLDLGVPIAIYQLPQVTENEIEPRTVASLAKDYPNFCFFKDSSGKDRVALSDLIGNTIVTLRGAEGDYSQWMEIYQGLLLSTANCFPEELSELAGNIGNELIGIQISETLTRVVSEVFMLVANVKQGNAFTNANKAIDHFMAFGPQALNHPAPRLHAGGHLPTEVLKATAAILQANELMPDAGYVQ